MNITFSQEKDTGQTNFAFENDNGDKDGNSNSNVIGFEGFESTKSEAISKKVSCSLGFSQVFLRVTNYTYCHSPIVCYEGSDAEAGENFVSERGQWSNQLEFLLSCISMSVGLGNVWRLIQITITSPHNCMHCNKCPLCLGFP